MIVTICPPGPRSAVAPVGSLGAIAGAVTNASGGAGVAGVTVQALQAGSVIGSAVSDGSGNYTISNLAAGTYTVWDGGMPAAYCVADAGTFSKSVSSGGTTTCNFSVQVAASPWLGADLSGLSLTNTDITNGKPWTGSGTTARNLAGVTPAQVTAAAGQGPGSGFAMQYEWPDRSANTCFQETTYSLPTRIFGYTPNYTDATPDLVNGEIWIMCYDRYSTGFQMGKSGCTIAYKALLLSIEATIGGVTTRTRAGIYFGGGATLTDFRVTTDWNSGGAAYGPVSPVNYGNISNTWNRWAIGITGLGAAGGVANYYRNGVLMATSGVQTALSGYAPFGATLAGNQWAYSCEIGENMNNGPMQIQQRYIGAYGLYPTRPGLL